MAVVNFSITVPDADLPRVTTALKSAFNVGTNAAAQEAFRQFMMTQLVALVKQYERDQAAASVVGVVAS